MNVIWNWKYSTFYFPFNFYLMRFSEEKHASGFFRKKTKDRKPARSFKIYYHMWLICFGDHYKHPRGIVTHGDFIPNLDIFAKNSEFLSSKKSRISNFPGKREIRVGTPKEEEALRGNRESRLPALLSRTRRDTCSIFPLPPCRGGSYGRF